MRRDSQVQRTPKESHQGTSPRPSVRTIHFQHVGRGCSLGRAHLFRLLFSVRHRTKSSLSTLSLDGLEVLAVSQFHFSQRAYRLAKLLQWSKFHTQNKARLFTQILINDFDKVSAHHERFIRRTFLAISWLPVLLCIEYTAPSVIY